MPTWTNPTTTRNYSTEIFQDLQSRADSQAKMFDDGVSWTSLPTNTIRWNSSNDRFEKWNGSTWANLSTSLTGVAKTANNLSDLASASSARTNLGLGTIAVLNSPLPLANGGTSGTDAATARTGLGLGTIATQNASAVAITGGTLTNLALAGAFTFAASITILASTSGTHNATVVIGGGNGVSTGGSIGVYGNNSGNAGFAFIATGQGLATCHLDIVNYSAGGYTRFYNNGQYRWYVDGFGNFSSDTTYGGDVQLFKAGTYLKYATISTWAPTIACHGTLTVNSFTIIWATWDRIGSYIHFKLRVTFTVTGGTGNYVYFTTPFNGVAGGGGVCLFTNGDAINDYGRWHYSKNETNKIECYLATVDNVTAPISTFTTAVEIMIDGKYRAV